MTFKKINSKGGETYYNRETGVSYEWSFMSNANGSAFGRAHGTSAILFRIKVENVEVYCEKIGSERVMADARPVAREYLRDTGKALVAEIDAAARMNKYV
jgi:hypothetical protein